MYAIKFSKNTSNYKKFLNLLNFFLPKIVNLLPKMFVMFLLFLQKSMFHKDLTFTISFEIKILYFGTQILA